MILIDIQAQSVQKQVKKGIPPFDIQLVSGQHFKSSDLKKRSAADADLL